MAGDVAYLGIPPDRAQGRMALIVVARGGGVLDWSGAGEAAVSDRLGEIVGGRLRFADPANEEALAEGRRRLAAGRAGEVIVRFSQDQAGAAVFAYLVDGPAAVRLMAAQGLAPWPGAAALVFPREAETERLWESLRDAFGVTTAEIRLAARLKDGMTLKEGAADLGVSLNTARNQLKSIFDKMGLRRQCDLVRTLGQLGALDWTPAAA